MPLSFDAARAAVSPRFEPGDATGQIPFTPDARKALELALREALGLGRHFIGVEHLLLGVLREPNGAHEVIRSLGVDPDALRASVLQEMGGKPPGRSPWEYRVDRTEVSALTVEYLNEIGADGWQLVSATERTAIFKRPRW